MPLPSDWTPRLRLPLMIAPMFLVSTVELAIAACRAGAIGSLPAANARSAEALDDWLHRLSSALTPQDAPWAVNLVVHRSYDRLPQDLELVAKYRPPLVTTALGSPRHVVELVHGYGGRVYADVNSIKHARQAASLGVDGLVLVSAGAGGHTGTMSAFAMLPAIRECFAGTVVLGGAITNGAGIRAAEVLGADLAAMGTAFIACPETMASDAYRRMLIESSLDDLVLTSAVSGVPAYWLKQSLLAVGIDPDALSQATPISNSDIGRWTKVWSAGHGVGAVTQSEPAGQLLRRLTQDYWRAVATGSGVCQHAQGTAACAA
jgi:nitronate monooxygenase